MRQHIRFTIRSRPVKQRDTSRPATNHLGTPSVGIAVGRRNRSTVHGSPLATIVRFTGIGTRRLRGVHTEACSKDLLALLERLGKVSSSQCGCGITKRSDETHTPSDDRQFCDHGGEGSNARRVMQRKRKVGGTNGFPVLAVS